ncbi:MAG: GntR family transcriptional regulator [Allosphingosinicella sp.]|uniref:GntR family transcriptional regulator n=1 Tax=Allosphingosinicella sp. TaxID=2823234 RepID=UPI0039477D82
MSLVVRTLSDRLVELVRDRILSGDVPADRPIRQDALAGELGVSKIPLREALGRLEQEGLLRSRANRGWFVPPMTLAEMEEVYSLRLRLEPDALAEGGRAAGAEDHRFAAEALDRLEQAVAAHGPAVGALNRAFHLALVRPAARPLTASILERLHILSERYVRMHLEPLGRDARANDEHRRMLEAWRSGDGEGLAALARVHTERTLADLRRELAA